MVMQGLMRSSTQASEPASEEPELDIVAVKTH